MEHVIEPLDTLHISATDQVFEALYKAVISVRLPPGAKVSEAEIAKQLGVSRQPVRDAFFRLSNLGFLSIRPQRATLITHISLRAVSDAVLTRTALEVECLRVAMTRSKEALVADLVTNVTRQKDMVAADRAAFHALDEAFHESICTVAGHAHVWSLIKDHKAHMDRIRYLGLSEGQRHDVLEDHEDILTAIRNNDDVRAETKLRAHIGRVIDTAKQIRTRYPDYFDEAQTT